MTHDQIREMVRRVNPIPDPSLLETVDAPVLVTERRTEMQTDNREVTQAEAPRRWRGALVGIAAAVAVLIAGSIFLLTRNDAPVAEPAPNATQLLGDFHTIAPGAYFVDTDANEETATRGTFVIEASWWTGFQAGVLEAVDPGVALLVLEVDQVWEAPCDGGASVPAGTTAKALADQFAAMPGFITREGLTPVSAFGSDGYHLVLEVPGGCAGEKTVWSSPVFTERQYTLEGQIVEYWFLDVEGTPVLVEASHFPESSEEEVAELRAVLDTLVITP